jgi:hypothetical protein
MNNAIKISEASHLITLAIQAKLVPMIHGSPAVGKSSIVKAIAEKFKLKLIDLRLAQCDPVDAGSGLPSVYELNGMRRAGYLPFDTFPIEGDPIPDGYNGWLLFLDEFNSAPLAVQAAAYKLTLDRMVGIHHMHKNVAIVCAGNLETDGAIVQPMSTAMQSRLVHLEVRVDPLDWIDWANSEHFDDRITSYARWRIDNVYRFDPDHSDKTYASPRTWEFVNRILKVVPKVDRTILPLLHGTVGKGVGTEFFAYCQIKDRLPKIEVILRNPLSAPLPDQEDAQYAVAGAVAVHADMNNCEPIMNYVKRLNREFQVAAARSMVKRTPVLQTHRSFAEWVSDLAIDYV